MQNKTTLNGVGMLIKKCFLLLALVLWGAGLCAQTISTSTGTGYDGGFSINNAGSLFITFVVENTTASPVVLTTVNTQVAPYFTAVAGTVSSTRLFYSATSLSGIPTITDPGWTQIGSGSVTVPAALTILPVISNINFPIPANTQYRFAIELTKGLAFSVTPVPSPNTFTNGGITLKVGTAAIAAAAVGYAGVSPTAPAGNAGAFFGGSVTLVPAVACTGTPTPGNTISSAASVCPATNFTLTTSNQAAPGTTGLSYVWQSGPSATGPWTTISGANGSTYSGTQTTATYYQVLVTCGAGTATATPVLVAMSAVTSCYCTAGATSTAFEKIANVTLNTINNSSTATAGYEDFTAITTSLEPGRPYPFSVSIAGGFAADQVLIFIDYNKNGVFTDAGETVFTSANGVGPHSGTLVVPFAALPGNTRMRVRMHDTSLGANATSCGTSTYGQVEDYTVNILPIVACTGSPNPGNTISSVPTVCPATNFTLSLQNFTGGSGVTYQWQSSPTGAAGSYTNIPSATAVTLTRTQTAATYYQAIVTCGAVSVTSTPIQVQLSAFFGCYCTPATSNCSLDDRIDNVTFGSTLNNNSSCSANGYANYRTLTPVTDVVQSAPNPMRVTVGPGGTEYVSVWIDYNHNAVFDAAEYTLLGSGNGVTINGTINIPATALLGQTGMRVRVNYNAAQTSGQACTTSTYGETEDYLVNIIPCVPVAISSQPTSTTISCGGNATFTTSATGSIPTYQWEYRTSATGLWFLVPNAAPYGGVNSNALTITNASSALNGYQYRAIVGGACVGADFTTPVTLTVTPLTLLVTPASGSVCSVAGTPVLLTVPNSSNVVTFTNNTAGAIPDGNATGIVRTFDVSGITGAISNMRLTMNVTHPYASDVVFVLKAPNGNTLNMSYAVGATQVAGANFTNTIFTSVAGAPALSSATAPWTGTFRPDAQVTNIGIATGPTGYAANVATFPLLYSVPNGTWTLAMYDYGTPDAGSFNNATLEITYGAAPASAIFTPTAGLFTDAAATVPYTGGAVTQVYAKPTATTSYTATVSTATCTAAAQVIPITVRTPPTAISAVANKVICPLGNTLFTADTTGGSGFTYQWKMAPSGSSTYTAVTNSAIYSGATSDTLRITGAPVSLNGNKYVLEVTTASCAASSVLTSAPGTLTVNPSPIVQLAASLPNIYPGQVSTIVAVVSPNAAATYSWYKDGALLPGVTGSSYVVDVDKVGVYTTTVTDVNGCVGTTAAGVKIGITANDNLFIYPSPNTGQFQVRYYSALPSVAYPRTLNVYDSRGARVWSKKYTVTNNYERLDVNFQNHGRGIYQVELLDHKGNRLKVGRVLVF